jgi:hypothetical protein
VAVLPPRQLLQGEQDVRQHPVRVAAPLRRAGVRCHAVDLHGQLGVPAVPGAEVAVGGLAQDHHPGAHAGRLHQVHHPPAALLLVDGEGHQQVAGGALLHEAGGGVHLQRQRALHVHGAAPVQAATSHHPAVGVVLPRRGVAHVHHVHVGGEHHRGRAARPGDAAQDVAGAVDLRAVEPQRPQLGDDPPRHPLLPPGGAGDADELRGELHRALEGEITCHGGASGSVRGGGFGADGAAG